MKTPVYIALAAVVGMALAFSPIARAEGVYGGTYDRGYYGSYSDNDVGMANTTRSDNLDQGRLDNRGNLGGFDAESPSVDRTYSDQSGKYAAPAGREGTSWDVGMTHPQLSDNLDQGRLDNRGLIAGPGMGSPSAERRYNMNPNYREARNLHEMGALIGTEVVDANGHRLGTLQNFVADDLGRIDFAVIDTGSRTIAVPFQALTFDNMGHYSLNMTSDQLAAAPTFDRIYLSDRTWPGTVYRYYGLTPRW